MITLVKCSVSSKNTLSAARVRATPVVIRNNGRNATGKRRRCQEIPCPTRRLIKMKGMRDTINVYMLEKDRERTKRYLGTGIWEMILMLLDIE